MIFETEKLYIMISKCSGIYIPDIQKIPIFWLFKSREFDLKMIKQKQMKTRGKISLSKYFQEFKEGERVSVVREHAVQPKFPTTIQGRSGIIESKRGGSYMVKIKDLNKEKVYIIHPIHLRRLK